MRFVLGTARPAIARAASGSLPRCACRTVVASHVRRASTREESPPDDDDFFASHLTEANRPSSSSPSTSSLPPSSLASSRRTLSAPSSQLSPISSAIFGAEAVEALVPQPRAPSAVRLRDPTDIPELQEFIPRSIADGNDEDEGPVHPVDTIPEFQWQKTAEPESSPDARQFASGTLLVKGLLEKHGFLRTQMIWKLGTAGFRPALAPSIEINPDGRIRMKKVATMREGRRPWVPPPVASLPDHPFRSMSFLKKTLLTALEDYRLIHKTQRHRPIRTEAEAEEARWQAGKQTRRSERNALIAGLPTPPPKIPATTVQEWGWVLGPQGHPAQKRRPRRKHPAEDGAGVDGRDVSAERAQGDANFQGRLSEWHQENEQMRAQALKAWNDAPGTKWMGHEWDSVPSEADWQRAAQLEELFHRDKEREAQWSREQQLERRAQYKLESAEKKALRDELHEIGQMTNAKKEAKRAEAMAAIRRYARDTGEDVNEWLAELDGELGEVPMGRLEHLGHGAKPKQSRFGPNPEDIVVWR